MVSDSKMVRPSLYCRDRIAMAIALIMNFVIENLFNMFGYYTVLDGSSYSHYSG